MKCRNRLFDLGIIHAVKLSVPVISVGNITAGGTGKTPFVIQLTQILLQKGYRVGVISRGYGRKSKDQIIVSEGKQSLTSAEISGDEPFLIATKCPDAIVIVEGNRVAAAQTAIKKYRCNIIVSDDAFQHRRLARDVDIVLWDGFADPESAMIIPAGRLRESLTGIRRASLLIFTKNENVSEKTHTFFRRLAPDLKQFQAPLAIRNIYRYNDHSAVNPTELVNKVLFAFCGIGNADHFFRTVESLRPCQFTTKRFRDHYRYQPDEIKSLISESNQFNCDFLITTEKDAINLPTMRTDISSRLLIIEVELKIDKEAIAEILSRI